MIWSCLLHLGFNFWDDRPDSKSLSESVHRLRADHLRCDDATWVAYTQALADAGANQVIIDLGEGVRWESCPELAVPEAWSKSRLAEELNRLRAMGLQPIPKVNFSAGHDEWMGEYARMISTRAYYEFCRSLIAEISELFGSPEYFHIGMDEEDVANQREYSHMVVRQHELWYSDLEFYAAEVARHGARPWMWSDKIWADEERFINRVSRDIVQSNWYYGLDLGGHREPLPGERNFQVPEHVRYFEVLDKAGFEQVPAGSNYANSQNMELLADYCRQVIAPERLLGFMQTTWYPTIEVERERLIQAAGQLGAAARLVESRKGGI